MQLVMELQQPPFWQKPWSTPGMKYVTAGANPMDLKRGIDKAVSAVISDLKSQSEVVGSDLEKLNK